MISSYFVQSFALNSLLLMTVNSKEEIRTIYCADCVAEDPGYHMLTMLRALDYYYVIGRQFMGFRRLNMCTPFCCFYSQELVHLST